MLIIESTQFLRLIKHEKINEMDIVCYYNKLIGRCCPLTPVFAGHLSYLDGLTGLYIMFDDPILYLNESNMQFILKDKNQFKKMIENRRFLTQQDENFQIIRSVMGGMIIGRNNSNKYRDSGFICEVDVDKLIL